jgi:NADH-quinone oxidoreductase subunit G
MPCTAKKFEAARPEFFRDGAPLVDIVLSTQGLIRMIRESGLIFSELEVEPIDSAFNVASGAGMIFGVSGGVAEAVLRRISDDKTPVSLRRLAFSGVRGMRGVKEASVEAAGREVKIAVVSGLGNAADLIEKIRSGAAYYDFVEVMACPGGCVNGAGQPVARSAGQRESRGNGLYAADRFCAYRRAEDNPLVAALYAGLLKGKTHELLHVKYERGKTLAIARGNADRSGPILERRDNG